MSGFASTKKSPRRRPMRVAEIIREELADIIHNKFRDPRVDGTLVTITEVDVSPDLKNAKIYYSTMKPSVNLKELQNVIAHATAFFRSELSHRLEGGYGVPTLHFIYDEIIEKSMAIDNLIDTAIKKSARV